MNESFQDLIFPGVNMEGLTNDEKTEFEKSASRHLVDAMTDLKEMYGLKLTANQLYADFRNRKKKPQYYSIVRPLGSNDLLFLYPEHGYKAALAEVFSLVVKKATRRTANLKFSALYGTTVQRELMAFITTLHFALPSLKVLDIISYNVANSLNKGLNYSYGSYDIKDQKSIELRAVPVLELLTYLNTFQTNFENKIRTSLTSSPDEEPINKYMKKSQLTGSQEEIVFPKYGRVFSSFNASKINEQIAQYNVLKEIELIQAANQNYTASQRYPNVLVKERELSALEQHTKAELAKIRNSLRNTETSTASDSNFPNYAQVVPNTSNFSNLGQASLELSTPFTANTLPASALSLPELSTKLANITKLIEGRIDSESLKNIAEVKNTQEGRDLIAVAIAEIAPEVEKLEKQSNYLTLAFSKIEGTENLRAQSLTNDQTCQKFLQALENHAPQADQYFYPSSKLANFQSFYKVEEQKAQASSPLAAQSPQEATEQASSVASTDSKNKGVVAPQSDLDASRQDGEGRDL